MVHVQARTSTKQVCKNSCISRGEFIVLLRKNCSSAMSTCDSGFSCQRLFIAFLVSGLVCEASDISRAYIMLKALEEGGSY